MVDLNQIDLKNIKESLNIKEEEIDPIEFVKNRFIADEFINLVNENKLYMLELNTQPGMTQTSLSPEQASYCGLSMNDMIKMIIKEASYEC